MLFKIDNYEQAIAFEKWAKKTIFSLKNLMKEIIWTLAQNVEIMNFGMVDIVGIAALIFNGGFKYDIAFILDRNKLA